ncbi:hypothetical protein [Allokutzneria oryzae]|uniref:Barstar (barnase inhibitor) domain-containing protein n=1 Tax=Allokutzneria oryzae TaxID=1378989 RepID=A0ABV6A0N7_9PSEU
MGIEIELHSSRPARGNWKKSRTTLVRGSYEHGYALADVLSRLEENGSGKLGWVDPFGDTLFNEQEAEAALLEIPGLLRSCSDAEATAAVRDLEGLLRTCARTPGSYLWFMGD